MQVRDARAVPEAASLPKRLAFKTAESASGQMIALDEAEGIVTAIVSVTGTLDEVDDIIMPGAYTETLTKRRPKVCWAHSWEHPIGRVLYIEELMPGDDRLPKQTKDGAPWPREAGALVATMQFNMRSTEGKDAFEAVRFYSETGECEYSIGYNVPAGKSTRDNRGTRHIKSLDLYELSVVLFGAHTMTGTISIKAALAAAIERKSIRGKTGTLAMRQTRSAKDALAAVRAGFRAEVKAVSDPVKGGDPEAPTEVPDHIDGVMVAVYPDPAAADAIAKHIAGPDPTMEKSELHVTLAYLGKASELTMTADEVYTRVSEALQGENALTGKVGGIGMFPDNGDGAPTWAPVDVPGLTMLRETIAAALGDVVATDHGFTPHMTIGYDVGLIDPVPEVPVTFSEVAVVYGEQTRTIPLDAPLDPDDAPWGTKGATMLDLDTLPLSEVVRLTAIESLREQAATPEGKAGGADRNRGGAEELRKYWTVGAGGAKIRWGTSGDFTRCSRLLAEHMTPERAKGYCANRHKEMTGMWPGDKGNKGYDPALEQKMGPDSTAPAGKGYPHLPGSAEERHAAIYAAVTEAMRGERTDDDGDRFEWDHVSIDATFEDHVIATRMKWSTDERETWDMDYVYSATRGVDLGEPEQVELTVVAVDVEGNEADDTPLGDVLPLADDVLTLAAHMKAAHASALETKSGRVLSGQNERKLRDAVETLVNVLSAAGMNIALVEATDDDAAGSTPDAVTGAKRNERKPIDPAVDMSTTSPSASVKSLGNVAVDGDTVVIDFEAHQRMLDGLIGTDD